MQLSKRGILSITTNVRVTTNSPKILFCWTFFYFCNLFIFCSFWAFSLLLCIDWPMYYLQDWSRTNVFRIIFLLMAVQSLSHSRTNRWLIFGSIQLVCVCHIVIYMCGFSFSSCTCIGCIRSISDSPMWKWESNASHATIMRVKGKKM